MSASLRRGARVGVRFADESPNGDVELGGAVGLTLADPDDVPLVSFLGHGRTPEPRGTPSAAAAAAAAAALESSGGDGDGDLHMGGLRMLQDELGLMQDDAYGTSRGDSDADAPLDAGMNGSCGGDGVGTGVVDGTGVGAGGVPGADLLALGLGRGAGGGGGRRHHRGVAGKGGKGGGKGGKQAAMRTWLRIDKSGEASILQADKWRITHKLGIQTRDLRLLDPALSTTYPSAILCRDKAIVVNLEHLKAIITTQAVLVVNPEDTRVLDFINELKGRLAAQAAGAAGGLPQSRSFQALTDAERLKLLSSPSSLGLELPFELKALEVCLDVIAGHLDQQTQALEGSAYPALDALAGKVSSPNLERVRRIKNNLVRLTTRVETVREVLEKFLDDDSDMHALNLSAKELHEQEEARAAAEALQQVEVGSTVSTTGSRSSGSSSSASSDSSVEEAETAVVEMLLETYFMHVDNTYNKLQTLHEYIGDTEDLVNIKLDQHRNQLITIDLMLTALTTCLAMMTAVGAWFGMNLTSGLEEEPRAFVAVATTSSLGALSLLVAFVWWLRRAKLIIY